ncbi:MAG: F0F1 ATP synthase subunit A [Armatimonadetes bacterium]|nr:F0F1 ATP synthase subunit A [Armatimonadota bacterium]MBS1728296.1 F0F1 ATP synthase subunit A [Armatimonadota bacterium]
MMNLSSLTTLPLAEEEQFVSFKGWAFYLLIVIVFICVFLGYAKKGYNGRVFTSKVSRLAEQLYLFLENMVLGAIGPHGRKYLPLAAGFWILIFVSNILALLAPMSPTTVLSFNVGLAVASIAYVQYEGIKANGFFGHVTHFAGPKLGLALLPITLMIFVIEIFSELMKNMSLSIRLFANMHGGHAAVESMNSLFFGLSVPGLNLVPLGEFLLPLKILTCVVQALVFTLLTCVYLGLVTSHGHGDEAHAH